MLDRAAQQLNARGVSLTSLTDLADELGVSRAALYHYVEDRSDLVFQVYRRSCEILARRLGEAAQPGRPALSVVGDFVRLMLGAGAPEIAALSEIGLLRTAERETILGLHEGVVARLAAVLEAGVTAGEIRPCKVAIVSRSIISMINWAPLAGRWTIDVESSAGQEVVDVIQEVIRRGVAADRSAIIDPPAIDFSPLLAPKVAAFDREALAASRRETILATASRLFNAKGVDTTSLDEIAAELGATKRLLYHHVGDKPALVSACYDRAYCIYLYFHDRATEMGLSPLLAIAAISRYSALAQQHPDLKPLLPLAGFEALSAEERTKAEARSRRLAMRGREWYRQGQASGELRAFDLDLMLLVAPGPYAWLAKNTVELPPVEQAETAVEISEFVRIGIAPV